MPTTIQVNESTLEHLRRAKEEMRAGSYDEVVQRLLMERSKRRVLGIAKGVGPFRREDRGHRD